MKLALVGVKGSGKDFLADKLFQYKGYQKIAFADAVKDYCNGLYPNLEKYNLHETKDTPVPEEWNKDNETPRDIWYRVSNEKKVQEDEEFFFRITLKSIDKLLQSNKNLVITDVRSLYEYKKLKQDGFTIIYVNRPGKESFNGYDARIKEFYEDIELVYENNTDGISFIRQLNMIEEMEKLRDYERKLKEINEINRIN